MFLLFFLPWAAGTSFGLPELQLGIIPGFGGTQRLPRAVGLQKAVEMMLTSAPIKAEAAAKLGLVDLLAPPQQLLGAAKQLALEIAGALFCVGVNSMVWCVRMCGGLGSAGPTKGQVGPGLLSNAVACRISSCS
jgi:enoyl-CoA hydratase/carnithine racemase